MHTLFVSTRAMQWWSRPGQVRILHRFDAVCNLLKGDGQLLTLALPAIEMGPFSHQTGADQLAALKTVSIHQTLTVKRMGANHFRLETTLQRPLFEIDLQAAALWEARPPWQTYLDNPCRTKTVSKKRALSVQAEKGVLSEDPALITATKALITALLSERPTNAISLVDGLAGRGPGLTPLGDDILIGILHGLTLAQKHPARLAEQLAERAATQTTTLSAAWLRAAAKGEASAPWHAFIEGKPGAIERILQTGATSGSGAWFGFQQLMSQVA